MTGRPLRLVPFEDGPGAGPAGPQPAVGDFGPPDAPEAAAADGAGTDGRADAGADGRGDGPADGRGDAGADARADGPAGAAGDGPADGGALVLPGLDVTTADRAAVLARHWIATAGRTARRTAGRPGSLLTEAPPPLADAAAYYAAAPWLPEGHPGGALAALGRAYGYAVALPLLALLYALAWLVARPARLAVALIVIAAVAVPALA